MKLWNFTILHSLKVIFWGEIKNVKLWNCTISHSLKVLLWDDIKNVKFWNSENIIIINYYDIMISSSPDNTFKECEIMKFHNFTFFKNIIMRWNQECEIVKFHNFTFFKSIIMRWNQECEIVKLWKYYYNQLLWYYNNFIS